MRLDGTAEAYALPEVHQDGVISQDLYVVMGRLRVRFLVAA